MKLERKEIERFSSNYGQPSFSGINFVKEHSYRWVRNYTLSGDAPKEFVRIYNYCLDSSVRKSNFKTWPLYLAKTGHKWYPNESLTEHLLNKLGEIFGLTMAESGLAVINNQLRFLSKYFLNIKDETLVHGAEIFAGYLEDMKFVESVEEQGESRQIFTLQFVEAAVNSIYPEQKDEILHELARLLLYDALVGNNDRHYFNWGVIISLKKKESLRFAPVYDTARGLFWNDDDAKIIKKSANDNEKDQYIKKYCKNSRPKLGWEGDKNIDHFSMVEHIYNNEFYISKQEVQELFNVSILNKMLSYIDINYSHLFIEKRIILIKDCLKYRYNKIINILNK